MAQLAKPDERRAHFTEEKRLAALTTPLHSEGQLSYRKPGYLEKITVSPRYESLIVTDGQVSVKDGPNDPPKTIDVASHPELAALIATISGAVSGDLPLLRRYYDVTGTGTAASWSILLHPRDPAVARLVTQVQLVGNTELRGIQTLSPNGDSDTLTITPQP